MPPNHLKDKAKNDLESLGEHLGRRVAKGLSKDAGNQGGAMGKRAAKTLLHQAERLHNRLEKEAVTKKEQLGLGGKIGTGLGIIGKHFLEKHHPSMKDITESKDLVSQGRTLGAKGEKILKKGLKKGLMRMRGGKRGMGKSEEAATRGPGPPDSRATGS